MVRRYAAKTPKKYVKEPNYPNGLLNYVNGHCFASRLAIFSYCPLLSFLSPVSTVNMSGHLPLLHVPHPPTRNPRTPQEKDEALQTPHAVCLRDRRRQGADPRKSPQSVARHARGAVRCNDEGQEIVSGPLLRFSATHPFPCGVFRDFQNGNDGQRCKRDDHKIIRRQCNDT